MTKFAVKDEDITVDDTTLETLKKTTGQKDKAPRKEYSEAESLEAMETLKTSGKKGVHLPRMNLAFKPSNFNYLQDMSSFYGVSKTEYINQLIEDDHKKNKKVYEELLTFRSRVK